MTDELETYRREIDRLDEQLAELLKARLGIVKKVGTYKERNGSPPCPIRPGREATMLRRIATLFAGSDFAPAAAAQLWRTIIGTSTALEARLSISIYAPGENRDLFWLAREYFGPAAILTRQPHVKRVIGDVMDGTAAVGIIPPLSFEPESHWWSHMLAGNGDSPKIFAHLPFVYHGEDPKHFPSALAFAKLAPEDSGDDVSLFVLQADHNVSQHRLQTAFGSAKLSVNWVAICSLSPDQRHHIVEIKGFVTPEHAGFKSFLAGLGDAIQQAHFLGAYAVPFTIEEKKEEKI
ncbi:MAG: chorismate mutase [Alphaproteobacteria bacterium]|nr:chorismate mutase [Alphaproteobacteria bacterium]